MKAQDMAEGATRTGLPDAFVTERLRATRARRPALRVNPSCAMHWTGRNGRLGSPLKRVWTRAACQAAPER